MKAINIAELKTHLSKYLRLVRRGERIVILDRQERIAELIPSQPADGSEWEKWADSGLVTLGLQSFSEFVSVVEKPTGDIQAALAEARTER